jgi:uncharacterized membrane protein YbaN (DUF454 family)
MRPLFFSLGILSLGLGIIGVWTPVLPTTPFILLASWAFSKSSPRFHLWLSEHPRFSGPIHDWKTKGTIRRPAKALALVSMGISVVVIGLRLDLGLPLKILLFMLILSAALFILSRPEN